MNSPIKLDQPTGSGTYMRARFSYDPDTLNIVHAVPGRIWDRSAKVWLLPATPETIAELRRLGAATQIEEGLKGRLDQAARNLSAAAAHKQAGYAEIAWPLVTNPYAHQKASLAFLQRLGSGALLHEMGTGKTACAIAYAELEAFRRVLVVCPNSVKRNWAAEIEKHTGRDQSVIPTGTMIARARQVATARYTIINCEALSLKTMIDAVKAIDWDLVIVDESTRFKNPTAKRTKALHKLPARHRVILTGSPITGKPEDAWAQFEFISPGIFGSWWRFSDTYLLRDYWKAVVGVRPERMDDLKARIDSRSYRVLKADVLDLPPKVYQERRVELSGDQEKAYRMMRDQLRVAIPELPSATAPIILTQLLRLTQITAGMVGEGDRVAWLPDGVKVAELDSLLNDELSGEQVVIFGVYQRELEELAKRYVPSRQTAIDHGYKAIPPIIYGPTPEHIRHELIEQFQAGDRRLLFVQAHSGGIGINLTAAKTAIFTTRSWSAEDYWQAQDRLHRIGQHGTVTIVNLVATGTIDETIAKALASKRNLADTLTGDDLRRLRKELLG